MTELAIIKQGFAYPAVISVVTKGTNLPVPLDGTIEVTFWRFSETAPFVTATIANGKIASVSVAAGTLTLAVTSTDLATSGDALGYIRIARTDVGPTLYAEFPVQFSIGGAASADYDGTVTVQLHEVAVTVASTISPDIPPGSITNSYLALMPAGTVKANVTGLPTVPGDVSLATLATAMGLGTASTQPATAFDPAGAAATAAAAVGAALDAHEALNDNPHGVTKAQVGLPLAENTADIDKPISTATQNALNGKQPVGSYAAAAHSHVIADTTGLQTTLDGKVDDASIFGTTIFGNPAPVSGTSFVAALFAYVEPRKVGGRILGVRLHSGTSAGNIDIVRFTAGSPLNVAQRVTVAVVASSYQEILLTTPIEYQAGDYLGGDAPASNRLMTSAISEFNGGRFLGVTGAATCQSTTKTYTTGLNFNLILEENVLDNTDDELSLVSQSALSPFVIGTPYTPVVGTNGNTAATTFYAQPMLDNTLVESVSLYGGTAAGIVQILKGVLNGATIDVTEQTYIRTTANALQTIDLPRPFVLKKGEYFGFRTNSNVLRYPNGLAEWSGGKFSGAFADITIPTTTLVVTDRIEMKVNARQSGGVGLVASMDVNARLFGALSKPLQFVCDGNSHFAGTGGNVPPPTQLGTFLGTTVLNFGLSGQTTQMMTEDAAAKIDPLILDFINRGLQPVLLLKEIYNDVRINSLTEQQGVDNMLAYVAARKLANPSVVIGLVNLCATVTSGVFTSGRVNTINTLLLAQALPAVGVDFLVDAYSNPELQTTGNLTYYQADGTHLTTAGAAIEARQIRRDFRKWLEAR